MSIDPATASECPAIVPQSVTQSVLTNLFAVTVKDTVQHFWFHNPDKMCRKEIENKSACLSKWQKSNAIVGTVWAVLWCAILVIIIMTLLQYLKRRRTIHQTRLNAQDPESNPDYIASRWQRFVPFPLFHAA